MATFIENKEKECFFCPKLIKANEPYVFWNGSHQLCLHDRCALMLALRLIEDAFWTNREVDDPQTVLQLVRQRMRIRP